MTHCPRGQYRFAKKGISLPNLRNGSDAQRCAPGNALAGSAVACGVRLQAWQFPKVIFVVDDDPDIVEEPGTFAEGAWLRDPCCFRRPRRSWRGPIKRTRRASSSTFNWAARRASSCGASCRARDVSVPVVFITANDTEATERAAIEAGCVAFLSKPFTAKALWTPSARHMVARSMHAADGSSRDLPRRRGRVSRCRRAVRRPAAGRCRFNRRRSHACPAHPARRPRRAPRRRRGRSDQGTGRLSHKQSYRR